jgi:YfiR/HmsC-like
VNREEGFGSVLKQGISLQANPDCNLFCVDGDAFLSFALSRELRMVSVRERKVVVRLVKKKSDFRGCDAVIFAQAAQKRVANALQDMEGSDVLTLGETEGFLKAGGIVQLSQGENGWRFEVNLDAAQKAKLKLDARLLQMAKSVVKNGGSLVD